MLKRNIVLTVFFITLFFGCLSLSAEDWLDCWLGDGDGPVWDRCEDLCNDRGEYCRTVFPRKSYCNSKKQCLVDFWMVCTDGYKRVYYDANTGYSYLCEHFEPQPPTPWPDPTKPPEDEENP